MSFHLVTQHYIFFIQEYLKGLQTIENIYLNLFGKEKVNSSLQFYAVSVFTASLTTECSIPFPRRLRRTHGEEAEEAIQGEITAFHVRDY